MEKFYTLLKLSFIIIILSPGLALSQGCLDATLYFGNGSNTMNAFRGDDFITMQWSENVFSSPGNILNNLSGLSDEWSYIDAAYEPNNGTYILTQGSKIAFLNKADNSSLGEGLISDFYPSLPTHFAEGIDAAFAWTNGDIQQIFFFKGNEWMRYDWDHNSNVVTYNSGPSTESWGGVLNTYFSEGIDAALYHDETYKVYFFHGNQYIRYDALTGTIDDGYPLVYNEPQNWGNYPDSWSCTDEVVSNDCGLNYQIPDNGCSDGSEIEISISNTPGNILGTDVEIESVSIFVEHTYIGDLTISLISPSGKEVLLADQVGGNGDNFGIECGTPTTFVEGATNSITSGTAPFQGIYRPVESFDTFYDGSNPNGIWTLKMCDNANQDFGVLQVVEIVFATITDVEIIEDRNNEISLYPNPNNGIFNLEWDTDNEETQIIVRDIVGKIVYQKSIDSLGQQTLNLSQLPKGNYLLQIQTVDRILTKKLIIQ